MSEETMKDFDRELEASYDMMGDGVHDTDALLAWKKAEELMESKEDVTVTVNGIVKGGVTVDFDGLRGFVPASRLTLERLDDLNPFLLTEITVRVIEVDKDKDKLVLSARERLKEEAAAKRQNRINSVKVGTVLKGTVATIKDYGVFVDLENGLSGLVHISEMSHERIKHPGVMVKEGQEVEVKVINVKDGKLSLSMKALVENPEEAEAAEPDYKMPKAESIGTSMGDLFKNLKF